MKTFKKHKSCVDFFFLSKFRKWSASCFQSTQSQLKSEPSAVGASCSSRCLSKPPLLAGWGAEAASVQPGGAGEACGMALRSSTGQCSHLGLLFFFFLILFIYFYFWLSWVFAALLGLSLVEASRDYSLAVVPRLLAAVTSLAVERCNFKLANTGAA